MPTESLPKRRERAIQRNLKASYHIYDICTTEAIQRLADTGVASHDDILRGVAEEAGVDLRLTPTQRIQHLRSIVECLQKFGNYHLFFAELHNLPFFMAKEGHSLLIECFRRNAGNRMVETDIAIKEHVVIKAFCNMPLWQHALTRPQDYQDHKERVIASWRAKSDYSNSKKPTRLLRSLL